MASPSRGRTVPPAGRRRAAGSSSGSDRGGRGAPPRCSIPANELGPVPPRDRSPRFPTGGPGSQAPEGSRRRSRRRPGYRSPPRRRPRGWEPRAIRGRLHRTDNGPAPRPPGPRRRPRTFYGREGNPVKPALSALSEDCSAYRTSEEGIGYRPALVIDFPFRSFTFCFSEGAFPVPVAGRQGRRVRIVSKIALMEFTRRPGRGRAPAKPPPPAPRRKMPRARAGHRTAEDATGPP